MTSELLPCPFCGGEAGTTKAVGEWWARCLSCEATTVLTSAEDRAITAWNTRAKADQIMGVEGDGDEMTRLLAAIWFYGGFVAETPNERRLQYLLERRGAWPLRTEVDLFRVLDKPLKAPTHDQ